MATPFDSRVGELLGKVLLLSLPFIALVASYVILDPFWVIYHYPSFSKDLIVNVNRDYVSTQMYLNTVGQRHYQSFILGNSRSMAFHVRDWAPYINDTTAFHFDASNESLFGVLTKLRFLESQGTKLHNILLVADPELLKQTTDLEGHIYRKDPRTTHELSLGFQLAFLKSYLSSTFYIPYLERRFLHMWTPEMTEVLQHWRVYYDPSTNDILLPDVDTEIRTDSVGYYARNIRLPKRPHMARQQFLPAVIAAAQLQQLVAISNILKRNNTGFQLIISPLYHQEKLNPVDFSILQRTFGAAHVHDFSGLNEFTIPVGNYYEENHYRPIVGRKILRAIYASTLQAQ